MKKYLLDTDILIDLFKKQSKTKELLHKLSNSGKLIISSVTIAELRTGWTEEQASEIFPRLYAIVTVLPVTQDIAELAGKLRNEYKPKGKQLPTVDTFIAATAIINDCHLITRNTRDYPMPELKLYPLNKK